MTKPSWLPPLVCFSHFGGEWDRYIEAVYTYFKADFIDSRAHFRNRVITLKRHPLLGGKETTFWHITSEGEEEDKRVPDIRRCERIRWPRPMIEHHDDGSIRCWPNIRATARRRNERRIVLWFYDEDYVVVLADRGRYVLLWTAYYVSWGHTRRKLLREYEDYQKRRTPP
ncbi:MAG: hypothetical protein IBX67_02580 [Dehalococcoidia bacterium]|nr:hypothetical protein [Dehalococcoidia bacterium]